MPSHAVVLQGIWVRAARAREGVWAIGRVQLQVQRLAATRCESLRASQPPERCGPVPQARRRRLYLNVDEDIGRRGRAPPSRALALLEPRLSQPALRLPCRCSVRLSAIVRAPFLLRSRDLLELLLIISAFFRGSGSSLRCSSCEEPERTRCAHRLLRACRY